MSARQFVRSVDESDCPDFIDHTRGPSGYIQWHAWARKMGRTHRQVKCSGCGLYAIWLPKPPVSPSRFAGLAHADGYEILQVAK